MTRNDLHKKIRIYKIAQVAMFHFSGIILVLLTEKVQNRNYKILNI